MTIAPWYLFAVPLRCYDGRMPTSKQERLTEQEFEEAVGELAQDEIGVARSDAEAAVRELGLPAEKLDEAVATVRARNALREQAKTENKKKLTILAAIGALVLATVVGASVVMQGTAAAQARITATDPTLAEEAGQLRLSAKLSNAPNGEPVKMSCDWKSPDGALIHQNAWETKPVSHELWETHCVLKSAPPHVQVQMRAHGKVVAESSR
jgi:hypothetical protein